MSDNLSYQDYIEAFIRAIKDRKYFISPSDWVELSQLTQDLSDEDDKKLFERIEKWLKQKSHRSHIWQAYQEQLPLGGGRTSSKGSCKKLLDNAILKNSPSSDNK